MEGLSTFHQPDSTPGATFSTLPFDPQNPGSHGDLAHFTSSTQPPVATFPTPPTDLRALVLRHSGRAGCF